MGRTATEAEAPILWPPDGKNWLTEKDSDAGQGWRQEEKGLTEDEMDGWHHRLDGHDFEQALGDDEGQGSQACYSSWGHKKLATEQQQQQRWLLNYICLHIFNSFVPLHFSSINFVFMASFC